MDKSYDKSNVIKTLETMITCNKMQAEGYPECVKDCDNCSLLYEQGNFEERIEALEMAIKALEQEPKTDSWSIKDVADTFKKHGLIRVQEPSGDAISRQAGLDMVEDMTDQFGNKHRVVTEGMINLLPPVTPLPKAGHWIEHPEIETSTPEYLMFYGCSECGDRQCFCKSDIHKKRFCSNCGCRMIESQERSE